MNSKAFDPPGTDDRLVWDHWLSVHRFPAITAADEVGLLSYLATGRESAATIADALSLAERPLTVLLGYLAAMGLAERRGGGWQATSVCRSWLDPDSGGYWGPLLHVYRANNPLHERLVDLLQRDDVAGGSNSAIDEWERGELPPEMAERIASFMNAHSISAATAVARDPRFRNMRSILDVGGGSGVFSIALTTAWPELAATVLDIDTMCDAAGDYIDASGATDRVSTTALNMFTEDFPGGFDAHFYSNVFHDWSETTNALLARKSFAALASGGRILLHEMLVDDDGCGPETTLGFSILMLTGTRGRQYGFAELRQILEGEGFIEVTARQTGSGYYSLVSATKP